MPVIHGYALTWDEDGDYVILATYDGNDWTEHTRWLIPNTQIED